MKKNIKYLFLFSILFAVTASASAYSSLKYTVDPHDSLLFDGENNVRTETFYSKSDEECVYRVTYVKGNATGKIRKMRIFDVCGIRKDTIYEYENGAIEKYSVIQDGEQVKTGPESTARIEFSDGSVIVLGPNTDYTLPSNVCDVVKTSFLESGSLWTRVKKLIGGGKFEISTHAMAIGVRGTEFTVEIVEENGVKYNVVKVYEGSVEVTMKKYDTKSHEVDENNTKEQDKLTEEYEAGKITLEEFSKRTLEIANRQPNVSTKIKFSEIIEPGYLIKTDGKALGDPVPFSTSNDTWFIINE
jgi:hypothetical protein